MLIQTQNNSIFFLQISTVLEKSPSPWFAGGPNPTSADFMMLYPMEVLASPRWSNGQNVPAKIKGWVENVHSRPQFKRVRLAGIDGYCSFI